jgi:FdhD protein
MLLPDTITINTHRYSSSGLEQVSLEVSAEYSILLLLNGQPQLSIACSGTDLACLAVGRLISSGMLSAGEEVKKVDIDENSFSVNVVTAGGENLYKLLPRIQKSTFTLLDPSVFQKRNPEPHEEIYIDPLVILSAMSVFLNSPCSNQATHGMHSAALFNIQGKELSSFDEIGRHNAVDKLLGQAILRGTQIEMSILLCTGRVSAEIVQKAFLARIPVIATRSATTSRAIEIARNAGIILITGVKEKSFYIHHGVERLL